MVSAESRDLKYMRMAIEEAKKSLRWQGQSQKVPPNVGVVIVKDDNILAKAHRSDIENENHAEFVALQRKCWGRDVTGATLYTTLEPCFGVRKPPKKDCAIHIVRRRIAEVVVGTRDPDTRVYGKGIEYLEQKGVKVRYFPKSLEDEIKELNKEYEEYVIANPPLLSPIAVRKISRRALTMTFVDDLHPDPLAIHACASAFRSRRVTPVVRWPEVNDLLLASALKERAEIVSGMKARSREYHHAVEPRFSILWLQQVDAAIGFAQRVRAHAATRIPKMWSGIKPYFSSHLDRAFQNSLYSYLTICNAHILLALSQLQRTDKEIIFPRGVEWIHMKARENGSLSGIFRDLFQKPEPFFTATVSRIGEQYVDYDVYGPESAVRWAWKWSVDPEHLGWPSLYAEFVVPQIEFALLSASSNKTIQYGELKLRRVLNDKWEELPYP